MQKISSELVKKILRADLTQAALANLLQISRIQDSTGRVRGLSYKYTSDILDKCNQTFYNAKKELEEKGFISTSKPYRSDIDVLIINNNFNNYDFSKGYINLQMKLFDDEKFYELSANEMAMILDILRMKYNDKTEAQGIDTKLFIQTYMDAFQVTERSVRRYLQHLRKYFNINCYNHKYFFKLKEKWKKDSSPGHAVEEDKYREHVAEVACKRANVKNPADKVIKDLKGLVKQYTKEAKECCADISALVIEAVAESIARTNELVPKPKWNYKVSVPYVHIILRENLNLI